ncbi:hypothetical protein PoB_001796000 [Plakobranchus ocellatus]|uniref:Uncharacterized protein n=1 Tax=Plakobranchus ocellatus TaxID=259542 RepID=A0AAV3Z8H9_9GAST|nr:hypothetical protein PoB_001796000 [Plakobranchus ocellatus]
MGRIIITLPETTQPTPELLAVWRSDSDTRHGLTWRVGKTFKGHQGSTRLSPSALDQSTVTNGSELPHNVHRKIIRFKQKKGEGGGREEKEADGRSDTGLADMKRFLVFTWIRTRLMLTEITGKPILRRPGIIQL